MEKSEMNKVRIEEWPATAEIQPLVGDGKDYGILYDAAARIEDVPGLTCEIGVRAGGGSRCIIDGILSTKPTSIRTHVAIDPYGSLDYNLTEYHVIAHGYETKLRDMAIPDLYRYCENTMVNFHFYQMTDTQYMKRFADGVPVYIDGSETIVNEYALVYFDGPHTTDEVRAETEFFGERAVTGSIFVYDDMGYYDHPKVEDWLRVNGWRPLIGTEHKFSYIKT